MAKSSMKSYAKKRSQAVAGFFVKDNFPLRHALLYSVDIKKAENGYVVSQWIPGTETKPGRDRLIVCKTIEEAQAKAADLLKM